MSLQMKVSGEQSMAQKAGWFDDEIVPIKTQVKDKDGNMTSITVTKDEGPRYGTTVESLCRKSDRRCLSMVTRPVVAMPVRSQMELLRSC